jgi:hypothetical protein
MGLVISVIFWGFEFGFNYLFQIKELRYLCGVIGFAIGYLSKFHLDKKFVFVKELSHENAWMGAIPCSRC